MRNPETPAKRASHAPSTDGYTCAWWLQRIMRTWKPFWKIWIKWPVPQRNGIEKSMLLSSFITSRLLYTWLPADTQRFRALYAKPFWRFDDGQHNPQCNSLGTEVPASDLGTALGIYRNHKGSNPEGTRKEHTKILWLCTGLKVKFKCYRVRNAKRQLYITYQKYLSLNKKRGSRCKVRKMKTICSYN